MIVKGASAACQMALSGRQNRRLTDGGSEGGKPATRDKGLMDMGMEAPMAAWLRTLGSCKMRGKAWLACHGPGRAVTGCLTSMALIAEG